MFTDQKLEALVLTALYHLDQKSVDLTEVKRVLKYILHDGVLHVESETLESGQQVVFDAKGGTEWDKKRALEVLAIGTVYTIKSFDIGGCYTDIGLVGVPGRLFNSCLFKLYCPDLDNLASKAHQEVGQDGQ